MQQIARDVAPIAAFEGGFVGVEDRFEDGEEGFKGDVDVDEGVDDPGGGADAVLEFKGVAFEHGEEVGDWEHGFGEVEAGAEGAEFFADGFVGEGFASVGGFLVGAFEEVLPCGADVGWVAVVGGLVD